MDRSCKDKNTGKNWDRNDIQLDEHPKRPLASRCEFPDKAITVNSEEPNPPFLWIADAGETSYDTVEFDKAVLCKQKIIMDEKNKRTEIPLQEKGAAKDCSSPEGEKGNTVEERKEESEKKEDQKDKKNNDGSEVDDDTDDFGGSHECVKCCGKEKKKKTFEVRQVSEERAKEILEKFKAMKFEKEPQQLTCPVCMKDVRTITDDASGLLTCLSCSLICIFGGVLGCCLIPFCVHRCSDVEHTCPNCRTFLGLSVRL